MKINWELLRQQKAKLLTLALEHSELDGLVNLLDAIQDEAVSSGLAEEEAVFGTLKEN